MGMETLTLSRATKAVLSDWLTRARSSSDSARPASLWCSVLTEGTPKVLGACDDAVVSPGEA